MVITILVAALLVFLVWALFWTKSGREDILDRIPGPPRLPILGNAVSYIGATPEEVFKRAREYTKTYGDRFVIKVLNRCIVQTSNPDDVEVILSHSRNISKNLPYKMLASWLGTGLLLSTGSHWQKRRKILTPAFHFNILKKFAGIIEERSKVMVKALADTDGREVDVLPIISNFTLHTICETAMGTQLDSDKSTDALKYKRAIMNIGSQLLKRLTTVWLRSDFIFKKSATGKEFNNALENVHSFANNVILQRKNNRSSNTSATMKDGEGLMTKNRLAMMDLLLEAEGRGEIDLDGIRDEVNTFMFEGHDTTAMALTFALMLLADHPNVQEKILSETNAVLVPTDTVPSLAQFSEMKYLKAVIKETLRLYPSVPFIAREVFEDFMLDDIKIKKDIEVAIHIYDLHRRADIYSDPEEFRPERFLQGGPEHPYAYVPFSAGPRNCIGQKFAMLEMKCVLSELCRTFHVTRSHRTKPVLIADLVLRPAHPVYLQFHAR